jgi:hypothetical protein
MIKVLLSFLYCLTCVSLPFVGVIVAAHTNNMFLTMTIGMSGIIGLAVWLAIDY